MSRSIAGSVAVITGASSGIARATALAFAERGASAVLAARSVRQAALECEKAGGQALAVAMDVADEAAVQALPGRAKEAFGRIDLWVNAAAVIVYGAFEKTPTDTYRRVLIHGARAALPYFRRARQRGPGQPRCAPSNAMPSSPGVRSKFCWIAGRRAYHPLNTAPLRKNTPVTDTRARSTGTYADRTELFRRGR